MGNKYTIHTFHIEQGKRYFGGYESLFKAIYAIYKLRSMKYFGCIYLEIR
jgi:hypothetical protein